MTAQTASLPKAKTGYRPSTLRNNQTLVAFLMSAPALIGLFMFVVGPLLLGFYWSTTDRRLISPLPTEDVGLRNYSDLLGLNIITIMPERDENGAIRRDENGAMVYPRTRTIVRSDPAYEGFSEWFALPLGENRVTVIAKDPVFMRALVNTFIFVLFIVPIQGGLALIMALLVNQKLRGIVFFRTAFFAPVVTSMAVIALVWMFLYNPERGLINEFLSLVSRSDVRIEWLNDVGTAMIAIVILSAWQSAGFQMVIFLAGLQGIPEELYEAARVDGASPLQQFWSITLPQLRNTTIFVVISTTILAFRVFTQVDILTKGGPQDSTVTLVLHAVNQGFRLQRIGYGSAVTVIFFIIVLFVAFIQRRVLRSENAVEG